MTDTPETLSFGIKQIILYGSIAGGCSLLILISIIVAAITMTTMTRKKNSKKKMMANTTPAPSDNAYNTLKKFNSTQKLNPSDNYSTLKQEWLPNLAYQSNPEAREGHELTALQERELPLIPQTPQGRHVRPPHYSNWSSPATPPKPGAYYSQVKPTLPSRPTAFSIQFNKAYEDISEKSTSSPTYATVDNIETEDSEYNTPYYAAPKTVENCC